MNLPKGPDSLCFDKDVFMKDDFDVDQFVADCRKHVQLEEMREDLEMYYKQLKTAMVELINKDYADFVNLSTNLVGMDKALNQLSVPLGQLREEVLNLRTSVSEVVQAIDNQLSKQDDLQNKKINVMKLILVVRSVEKIEKILHSQNSKDWTSLEMSSPLLAGQILERIATEFNQLQFHAVQSKGMPLLDKVRPRISGITSTLQQSLEGLLIQGLQTSNVDIVRHCLRTYATIDKTRDAEALVGEVLVKPYMDMVIVEQFVKSTPNGLQILYTKLLQFVPHHCRLLCEVTGMVISRYKEIAACLENAIADGLEAAPAGSSYHLLVSQVLWNSLVRCWAEKVYLPPLVHRFWKLTLQLISRYSKFLTEMLTKSPSTDISKDPVRLLPSSASSTSSHTSQDDGGSESGSPATLSTQQLVFIASDVNQLQDQITELSEMIKQRLEIIGYNNFVIVAEALEDSKDSLSGCIPTLNRKMTQHLTERCFRFLKSASEVPRLYRRTNKELPSRASAYMDNALRPLHQLLSDSKDMVKPSISQEWLRITLNDCTHRYFETISDVLSSVKKMEESLKRLKQARKTVTTNTTGTTGGPTDDSKIRLQLALDVEYLGEQIQKMGLQPADITMFSTLNDLVHGAQDGTPSEQAGP
ncbi:conserved oligomeric Golgi complex subunit 2 isoform X3 [Oncorhynchus tshawytscha]|uniref:conserved oligomeric Golgi complex subunit 2 isoform X3 n=1 Tax=Oncorhynchus tshawytscha TaxID=74940 RepID=UPI000D09B96C|nr:conserved oligomeric Golgi complex subunit 2 isoform X3 [Oncorhynchus tshawytscha]